MSCEKSECEFQTKTLILRRNSSTKCTKESYLVTAVPPWLTPSNSVGILATAVKSERIRVIEI